MTVKLPIARLTYTDFRSPNGLMRTLRDTEQKIEELRNAINERTTVTVAWTPGLIGANALSTPKDVTVVGAHIGDVVFAAYDHVLIAAGLQLVCEVVATDTVRVWIRNFTGGGITPTAGTLRVELPHLT